MKYDYLDHKTLVDKLQDVALNESALVSQLKTLVAAKQADIPLLHNALQDLAKTGAITRYDIPKLIGKIR